MSSDNSLLIACQSEFVRSPIGFLLTFCSYKKLAIFTTKLDAENQCLINHKCVCGAPNRQFLVGAVMCRLSFHLSVSRLNVLVKKLSFSFTAFSVTVTNSKGPSCLTFTFLSIVISLVVKSNSKPTFKSC